MKTRFAPSPTGFLHLGTARTALFNYLLAKREKGSFVLRIEDTDKERSSEEFENDIIESLKWLGISWDEGPYRQSERGEVYKKYLNKLLEEDKAYHCFCTKEELEAKKESRLSNGLPPKYDGKCAKLSKEEAKFKIERGESSVIRLKVPDKKIEIEDIVRGKVVFDASLMGDIVIARNLETPLYNFSVVVDDSEMGITHVIRGEDILSNTPKQIIISDYLGFKPLQYGHIPMILGSDKSKLSKRHGAVAVSKYREEGYLSEAMINFLVLLGWNPGDEREFFEMEELVKEFDVKKINKSAAMFNIQKLENINGHYIRKKPLEEITELCVPQFVKKGYIKPSFENREIFPNLTGIMGRKIVDSYTIVETGEKLSFNHLKKIVSLYKERMKKISEIAEFTDYFFKAELSYDKELLKWKEMSYEEVSSVLEEVIKVLESVKNWNAKELQEKLLLLAGNNRGRILWPLRASLTGKKSSAGPFEVAEALGRKKTINRLKSALKKL